MEGFFDKVGSFLGDSGEMVIEKSQGLAEGLGELDLADMIQDKIEDTIDQ